MEDLPEEGAAPRRESRRQPATCPACGSARVAKILYGLPSLTEELRRDMAAGRVLTGGCCITGDDPAWQCADCGQPIHRELSQPIP